MAVLMESEQLLRLIETRIMEWDTAVDGKYTFDDLDLEYAMDTTSLSTSATLRSMREAALDHG